MKNQTKQILVAGGAGFLGSHLCKALLQRGDQVFCLDNFSTGFRDNIEKILSHPNFTLIEADVLMKQDVVVDEIFNLACPASPRHYQKNPITTLKTNFLGSLHLLDLARECKAKIFQASTSEIYGDPMVHPQKESYLGNVNPIGKRACYDEGKRVAETLFFEYHRTYKVDIKVARIFNTYGPYMSLDDGRVVSNFIIQALRQEPLTVYGDGKQTRSFCYIEDLIRGILMMMDHPTCHGPINLGNPYELSVLELANTIIDLTHSSSSIVLHPIPDDDPKIRKPDISVAKDVLNWIPSMPLQEGLKATIEYFEKILKIEIISR